MGITQEPVPNFPDNTGQQYYHSTHTYYEIKINICV